MLTDEDKERIRDEEIFRAEVQKSLCSDGPNKVIAFLNTSLGIWFLSTLVIGLFGWSYAKFQASRDNEEQIIKLDREILARIESAQYRISNLGVPAPQNVFPANELLAPPTPERIVQTEYSGRNLRSLLYELRGRVPVEEEEPIVNAITNLQSVETAFLNKPASPEQVKDIFDRLSHLKDTRWRSDNLLRREIAFHDIGNSVLWWFFYPAVSLSVIFTLAFILPIVKNRHTTNSTKTSQAQS